MAKSSARSVLADFLGHTGGRLDGWYEFLQGSSSTIEDIKNKPHGKGSTVKKVSLTLRYDNFFSRLQISRRNFMN